MRSLRSTFGVGLLGLVLLGAQGDCGVNGTVARVYALTDDSGITRGCFPPLACPRSLPGDLGGTFRLRLVSAGPDTDVYSVEDVYWLARIGGEDVPITGWGTYADGSSEDRLQLQLRVGNEEPELFDSGPVPSGPPGNDEIDIQISIHGGVGFDTVIDVHAIAFPDRSKRTPCGPQGKTCDPASEVCVARTPVGPAVVYACEPVPSGCEQDRSCGCAGAALCEAPYDACSETGENQLQCACPECQ